MNKFMYMYMYSIFWVFRGWEPLPAQRFIDNQLLRFTTERIRIAKLNN